MSRSSTRGSQVRHRGLCIHVGAGLQTRPYVNRFEKCESAGRREGEAIARAASIESVTEKATLPHNWCYLSSVSLTAWSKGSLAPGADALVAVLLLAVEPGRSASFHSRSNSAYI